MKILNVTVVEGSHLYEGWSEKMQIVATDKGIFIDNIKDNNFVPCEVKFAIRPNVGFDWSTLIGKEVNEVVIYRSRGYDWINMPKKHTKAKEEYCDKKDSAGSNELEIIEVLQVKGRELDPRWESDMQVIITSLGKYIDNAVDSNYKPGYDWKSHEGKTISLDDVFFNESRGHHWINYNE